VGPTPKSIELPGTITCSVSPGEPPVQTKVAVAVYVAFALKGDGSDVLLAGP
jgi:hypothetical protein